MKKIYEELELEVIRFGAEDVITASAENSNTEETTPDDPTKEETTPDDPTKEPTPAGTVPDQT